MSIRIAPSILSANFAALGEDIRKVEQGGAQLLHVDVMDGHFVPNITIGPPVVKSIKNATKLPLDVHLMISDPDKYIPAFVDAGATMLTVHAEATVHLDRTLNFIRSLVKGGFADLHHPEYFDLDWLAESPLSKDSHSSATDFISGLPFSARCGLSGIACGWC